MYISSSPRYRSRWEQTDRQSRGKPACKGKSWTEEHSSKHTHMHTHPFLVPPAFPLPQQKFPKVKLLGPFRPGPPNCERVQSRLKKGPSKRLPVAFYEQSSQCSPTPNPKGTKQESSSWIPLYTSARAPTHPPHPHIYTHTYIHHEILWKFF